MKREVLRRSIVTHKVLNRELLFRIVKNNENIPVLDLTYKANGRGVYLEKDLEIIKKAQSKNLLERSLKTKIPESFYEELIKSL